MSVVFHLERFHQVKASFHKVIAEKQSTKWTNTVYESLSLLYYYRLIHKFLETRRAEKRIIGYFLSTNTKKSVIFCCHSVSANLNSFCSGSLASQGLLCFYFFFFFLRHIIELIFAYL